MNSNPDGQVDSHVGNLVTPVGRIWRIEIVFGARGLGHRLLDPDLNRAYCAADPPLDGHRDAVDAHNAAQLERRDIVLIAVAEESDDTPGKPLSRLCNINVMEDRPGLNTVLLEEQLPGLGDSGTNLFDPQHLCTTQEIDQLIGRLKGQRLTIGTEPRQLTGRSTRRFTDSTIYLTGGLELLLAVGLVTAKFRRLAGWLSLAALIGFIPVNVYAALQHVPVGGHVWGPSYLWIRLPLQLLLMAWAYRFAARPPDLAGAAAQLR